MGCTYVKEFKFAEGGLADLKQDKAMVKSAVHKHEKAQHPGQPLTKLKKGGQVTPSKETLSRRETKTTPTMAREENLRSAKVVVPRRSVPVAPTSPLLAMKCGGKATAK